MATRKSKRRTLFLFVEDGKFRLKQSHFWEGYRETADIIETAARRLRFEFEHKHKSPIWDFPGLSADDAKDLEKVHKYADLLQTALPGDVEVIARIPAVLKPAVQQSPAAKLRLEIMTLERQLERKRIALEELEALL